MKTRKELLDLADALLAQTPRDTAGAQACIALARELREGAAPAAPAARPAAAPAVGGAVFPFGKLKDQPLSVGTDRDLEYFAGKARETLADDGKQRFHAKEQILLAALNAEIARRGGAQQRDDFGAPPPGFDGRSEPPDDDSPPF